MKCDLTLRANGRWDWRLEFPRARGLEGEVVYGSARTRQAAVRQARRRWRKRIAAEDRARRAHDAHIDGIKVVGRESIDL